MANALIVQDNVASHQRWTRPSTGSSAAANAAMITIVGAAVHEVVVIPGVSAEYYLNVARFSAGDAPIGLWNA